MFSQDPRDTTTDPESLEQLNRDRIAGWWDLLGREPSYPVGSDGVVALLRAVDYRVDNDTLLQAVNDGWVPPIPRQGGRLAFDATSVITLSCALEARRLWQPFSKIHGHKLTMAEKVRELCEQEGSEFLNDLHKFDLNALLALLVQTSGDAGAVQVCAEALREKLRKMDVLV